MLTSPALGTPVKIEHRPKRRTCGDR